MRECDTGNKTIYDAASREYIDRIVRLHYSEKHQALLETVGADGGFLDIPLGRTIDILLTPEGALSGYLVSFSQDEVIKASESLRLQAKDASVGPALGTCYFEDGQRCVNELRFYDKAGAIWDMRPSSFFARM